MAISRSISALLILGWICHTSRGYIDDDRVPFGVMFDRGSVGEQAALEFKVNDLNVNPPSQPSKLKLDTVTKGRFVDTRDVYYTNEEFCDLVKTGVFAIFGTHTSDTIEPLQAYTSALHMPFITPRLAVNASGQELGYTLFMKPYYTHVVLDVIEHYGWNEVWYMFNTNDGMMRLQQLYEALARRNYALRINILRVKNAAGAWDSLLALDKIKQEDKRILLDMALNESEALLKYEESQPRTTRHHYFVVELGIAEIELKYFQYGGMNVTGFRMFDKKKHLNYLSHWQREHKSSYERAMSSSSTGLTTDAALTMDGVHVLFRALKRLKSQNPRVFDQTLTRYGKVRNNGSDDVDCNAEPVVPWTVGYDLMKAMREINLKEGLTGPVSFNKWGLRSGHKLDILEVTNNLALSHIATWREKTGLIIQPPQLVRSPSPSQSENRTRIVTSILTQPFLSLKEDADKYEGNDQYEGYCADLAKKITKLIEIDYKIVPVKDGNYGSKDENGTWNGMVGELIRGTEPFLMLNKHYKNGSSYDRYEGYCAELAEKICNKLDMVCEIRPVHDNKFGSPMKNRSWDGMVGELVRGEADLAIAPLTITAVREAIMDFSKPFMSLGISIMIKKPTKEVPGVFSFMYPLSYEIWMCVIFAYIGVSVVLFLVSRFSPFEWHIEDNTDGPTVTNNFTIFNSLWFSLGAFMQQGCDIEPRSMSGRIVGSVWWFFTLIIISSYTANLAAFLTVERMQSPIESADDLAKQTEIKYGTVESGSTKNFFKSSTIAVYERMWAFMSSAEESVFVKSNEEGVRRVRTSNGRYAFLMESTANDYTNQREPCDTMKVGNNLDSKGYGIGTPLGSDLRDKVTLAVLELRETGELTKMETKWWYDKGECGRENLGKKSETTNALKLSNVAGIFYILISGLVLSLIMAALEFLYKSNTEARRRNTSFTNAVRTKARLSIKGKPERSPSAVGHPDIATNHSMSTDIAPVNKYTYTPAAQLITFEGYADANTHTQV